MEVLHQSNFFNEEMSSNTKMSTHHQLVTNILSETVQELHSVQSEISHLQKQSSLLELKNQQLIDRIKIILDNLSNNFEMKDAFTQIQNVEVCDIGVDCDIKELTLVEIDNKNLPEIVVDESLSTVVENEIFEKEEIIEFASIEENVDHYSDKSFEPVVIDAVGIDIKDHEESVKERESYSTKEMLIYLAKYKIDFLKFLQCNRNNIEQIAGSCQELIRSFSSNSDNGNKIETKRNKPIETTKPKRGKTRSTSEMKPGVIVDTGEEFEDPSLKSSLYDDLDSFQNSSETIELANTDTTGSIGVHEDVTKIGGEKRINAMGVQSKMNLLKNRRDGPKSKKNESWKSEILSLESRHESHYPGTEQQEPIKKERDKREIVKPSETIFTTRMKERLHKQIVKSQDKPDLSTVVKYDLSTPDDPSFQLDSRQEEPQYQPIKIPTKTLSQNAIEHEADPLIFPSTKKNHSREKSKHKHKHSSKKKLKKISKDLEDGEII